MDESVQKHLEQPAELSKVARILLRSASMIETDGHWQGSTATANRGHICAILGIYDAAKELRDQDYFAADAARDRLTTALGFKNMKEVYDWNDATPTKAVIAKLRAVALGG